MIDIFLHKMRSFPCLWLIKKIITPIRISEKICLPFVEVWWRKGLKVGGATQEKEEVVKNTSRDWKQATGSKSERSAMNPWCPWLSLCVGDQLAEMRNASLWGQEKSLDSKLSFCALWLSEEPLHSGRRRWLRLKQRPRNDHGHEFMRKRAVSFSRGVTCRWSPTGCGIWRFWLLILVG